MKPTSNEPTHSPPANTDAFWPHKGKGAPSVERGLGNDISRLTTAISAQKYVDSYVTFVTQLSESSSSTKPQSSAPSYISALSETICCAIHWWKPAQNPACR